MERGDPLVGQVLKQTYRIARRVAVGGMGAIYEAEHIRLHRRVAIKVVLPWAHEEAARLAERFQAEVDAIAQVGHPHIVQVVDFDRMETGEPYLVMEYLEGETLEQRLERAGALPVASAVSIASQIAAALAEVHEHGIVHRDLKPANVFLLSAKGEHDFVKLLDFGVSQSSGRRRITGVREVVGTPEYMAPEQVQSHALDHRVDQFALSAMTYEMLTGRAAFPGDDVAAVLYQVLTENPPPITQVAPWASDLFDAVILRALAKAPERRYPTISQFAFALESAATRAGIVRERSSSFDPPPGPTASQSLGTARTAVRPEPNLRSVPLPSRPVERPPRRDLVATIRSGTPRSAPPESGHDRDATALFVRVRQAVQENDLEEAVVASEKLMALAAHEKDPAVLGVLAGAMPALDDVFRRYVGPVDQVIEAGPAYASVRKMQLSPRAAELLAMMDHPTSIRDVFAFAGIPERSGVRLLAGLLRLKVVRRASAAE